MHNPPPAHQASSQIRDFTYEVPSGNIYGVKIRYRSDDNLYHISWAGAPGEGKAARKSRKAALDAMRYGIDKIERQFARDGLSFRSRKKRRKNGPGMSMKTKHAVMVVGALTIGAGLAYLVLKPKEASAATAPPKQLPPAGGGTTPSGGRLPGLGAPLFTDGLTVLVAADVQSIDDARFLNAVTAAFAAQAPGITWVPTPIQPNAKGVLDLTAIETAAAAIDKGANVGDPTRVGVVLMFNSNDLNVQTPSEEFLGNIDMVEIPAEVMVNGRPVPAEFDPVEARFIAAHRTSTARIFGLTPAVGRADPSKFAASILADVRNPNGMPPGRSV